MGKIYAKKQGIEEVFNLDPSDARDLIRKNMEDKDSRYLMLIGRSDVLTCILEKEFKK
ncbi:MAG: hypothetical protein ACK53Y_02750 [bacterium]|jgi:hypothetical protein